MGKGKTGMGLKMIGDLIIMLEGTIDIKSQLGIGTEITLVFPDRKS